MKKKSLTHSLPLLLKDKINFLSIIISVIFTLFLAYQVSEFMFGKNSYEVYKRLKIKEQKLKDEIKRLQLDNAHLQKEYFELKNLEPEQ